VDPLSQARNLHEDELARLAALLDKDYVVEGPPPVPPFASSSSPWMIRRVVGGSIPDGATVEVSYTYIPNGTATICPNSRRARALLVESLGYLMKALEPQIVHIGFGNIDRLNTDARCRDMNQSDSATLAQWIRLVYTMLEQENPHVRVMLWADLINPRQSGSRGAMPQTADRLPERAILGLRLSTTDEVLDLKRSLEWAMGLGRPFLVVPPSNGAATYAACTALAHLSRGENPCPESGILVAVGENTKQGAGLGLDKAWSSNTRLMAWPEGLNAYFRADLWEPAYDDVLDVLVSHLNRRTLSNVPPNIERNVFDAASKRLAERLPPNDPELARAAALYNNLLDYIELEASFAKDKGRNTLERIVKLVEQQALLTAQEQDRTERIIETVRTQGLFVPSTILFGRHLLSYREAPVPKGHAVYESAVAATYVDTEDKVEANFNLLAAPGPICRIDFESVAAARIGVSVSEDGERYHEVQVLRGEPPGGAMGPALLQNPVQPPFVQVAAEVIPGMRAALRTVRLFALKGPAAAIATRTSESLTLDAAFGERFWPREAQVGGFLLVDAPRFGEAQTALRLAYTRSDLLIALHAWEPRMDTMKAVSLRHDSPLWEEESFEIVVSPQGGRPYYRFLVNPLNARFESRNGDAAWDCPWRSVTRKYASAWAAEIAIPLSAFGQTPPGSGKAWDANFIRRRWNVKREVSTWAWRPGAQGDEFGYGRLIFS